MPLRLARRPLALGLTAAAVATVSGCTALSGGYAPPVTVTVTPTVTVTGKAAAPTSSTATPSPTATRNPDLRSAVRGRSFDLGKITSIEEQGGSTLVTLDRWTVRGRSDGSVGRRGVDLTPEARLRFSNRNTISFKVPVDPAAEIVKQTCTSPDQPAQTGRTTLQELQGLPDTAAIVKLTLDDEGWATKVESNPVCADATAEPTPSDSTSEPTPSDSASEASASDTPSEG